MCADFGNTMSLLAPKGYRAKNRYLVQYLTRIFPYRYLFNQNQDYLELFVRNESTKSTKVSHQITEEKESSYIRYIYRGPKSYFEEIKELPSKLPISSRHEIEISVYAYIYE